MERDGRRWIKLYIKELNGSQHKGFDLEHDRRWWILLWQIGMECIAAWKSTMECDSSWQIRLGKKGTECIAMWRFKYGTWWEIINPIRAAWNVMDGNMTIHYEIWWEAMYHIRTERNWKELNGSQRTGFVMEHDRRWRIWSGLIGTLSIATWQCAMECDRNQWIRLGQKGTEWITSWRFF